MCTKKSDLITSLIVLRFSADFFALTRIAFSKQYFCPREQEVFNCALNHLKYRFKISTFHSDRLEIYSVTTCICLSGQIFKKRSLRIQMQPYTGIIAVVSCKFVINDMIM